MELNRWWDFSRVGVSPGNYNEERESKRVKVLCKRAS